MYFATTDNELIMYKLRNKYNRIITVKRYFFFINLAEIITYICAKKL